MELTAKTKHLIGIKSGGDAITGGINAAYSDIDKAFEIINGQPAKMAKSIYEFVSSNNQDDPNHDKIVFAHKEALDDSDVGNLPIEKLLSNANALGIYLLVFKKACDYWDSGEGN